MAINAPDKSIEEICENISDETGRKLAAEILRLFTDHGFTYKVKDDGRRYRVYCNIKKSKETLILGTMDMRKDFIVQLRVTDRSILGKLDELSENVRNRMLSGPDCRGEACRDCAAKYVFEYGGREYRKCHALMCNFIFHNPVEEDIPSILSLIGNEIAYNAKK